MNSLKAAPKFTRKEFVKIPLAVLTFSLLTTFFCSCNTLPDETQDKRTVKDLVAHLRKSGLKINKTFNVRYEAVLANDGIVMLVEGAKVEFYVYEPSIAYQKKKLDYAKKHKSTQVLGVEVPCIVNGKFVMFTYTENPNKIKVIKAFKKF